MSRYPLYLALFYGLILSSCKPTEIEIETDHALDELQDKQEISGSMIVDVSELRGMQVQRLLVNDKSHSPEDALVMENPGFYRMEIFLKDSETQIPEVMRIVLLDEERGEAEWGLNKWIPLPPSLGQIDDRKIILVHPASVPAGVNIPMIVKTDGVPGSYEHAFLAKAGSREFYIKQGRGSVQLPSEEGGDGVLKIDHRNIPIEIDFSLSSPLLLQDTLASDLQIGAGSYIRIEEDLVISPGVSLVIEAGTFISIATGINIFNEGILLIHGSEALPVTLSCSEPDSFWGGIISTGSGNRVEARHCIFSQSGYHTDGDYNYGHAHRQALVYCKDGSLDFDHCYMIDHIGQVFYPVNAPLNISNSLIQRAKTGGQINGSNLVIKDCIFTDFPDDSGDYRDEDNDALYLMGCNAVIRNSVFMYAKDDGLDSGGSGGGSIQVFSTHFESVFHEGAALSSGGSAIKSHQFTGCTFLNCGQGLELGYSSPNHQVSVDSCLFQANGIGIRYGDNYINSQHRGQLIVSNSMSIFNTGYDVWNMLREEWSADTLKMEFTNVQVSSENPMYPHLKLYESN